MNSLFEVNDKIVALIPARSGSKRIKNKNLRSINGKPLIGHSIEHALSAGKINEVYVSTDSEVIAEIARNYGALVPFLRPEELARDSSTDYDVFEHFLQWYKKEKGTYPKLIVQVRPTEPLRESKMLDRAIEIIENNSKADSLRSVSSPHQTPYKMWKIEDNFLKPIVEDEKENFYDMPTQSLPTAFAQDGFVDIIKPQTIINQKSMAGGNILGFIEHGAAIDIDDMKDLQLAKVIMKNQDNEFTRIFPGNIGIIQGRLSESCNNKLQNFPSDWVREFEVARKCGYSHIELFRDRVYNQKNLLWSKDKGDIQKIIDEQINTGVVVRSICDDYILNCDFSNIGIDEMQKLIDLLVIAEKIGATKVIYPLMEKSEIRDVNIRTKAAEIIRTLADVANALEITINIETNIESNILIQFIKDVGRDNVKICLDTGNLLFENIDPVKQIYELKDYIGHIHIKDKDKEGNNVVLTTGQLKLDEIIKAMLTIEYSKFITFETTRGKNYMDTAMYHSKLFNWINEESMKERK